MTSAYINVPYVVPELAVHHAIVNFPKWSDWNLKQGMHRGLFIALRNKDETKFRALQRRGYCRVEFIGDN